MKYEWKFDLVQSDGFYESWEMYFNSFLISSLICSSKHFLNCMVSTEYIDCGQGIINTFELRV